MLAGVSLDADTPSSSRFSVNFLTPLANLATSRFLVGLRDPFSDAGTHVSSLRVVAGLDGVSSGMSGGNDVEGRTCARAGGTTIATKCCIGILST